VDWLLVALLLLCVGPGSSMLSSVQLGALGHGQCERTPWGSCGVSL
jgi:hypothetical protein